MSDPTKSPAQLVPLISCQLGWEAKELLGERIPEPAWFFWRALSSDAPQVPDVPLLFLTLISSIADHSLAQQGKAPKQATHSRKAQPVPS